MTIPVPPMLFVVFDAQGLIVGAYREESVCTALCAHRAGWTYKPYALIEE